MRLATKLRHWHTMWRPASRRSLLTFAITQRGAACTAWDAGLRAAHALQAMGPGRAPSAVRWIICATNWTEFTRTRLGESTRELTPLLCETRIFALSWELREKINS